VTAAPVKVFYSYAHEDAELLEKLKTHLAGLKQRKLISEWHDGEITAGTDWGKEIAEHLASANVILLLISPDFISSDYVNDVELKKAIERHKEGTARVIPIILRPVNWDGLAFSNLKALPLDGRPVTRWPNRDEAFLDIAKGIEKTIGELNLRAPLPLTEENVPRLSPLTHIEPQSAVGFVPRKDRDGNDIIEQLRAGLAPGSSRVIALWGAGGVGKTALAAEAVRSLIHNYQQRVVWISADGRDEFALPNLLDEIANQFGRPEFRTLGIETKKQSIHDLVVEMPSLIVLDNFETVKPKEQALCLDWLSHISPSSALITTRARIELPSILNVPIKPMLVTEANEFLDRLVQQAQHRRTFEGIDKQRIIKTAESNPLILQWVFAQIDLAQDWREVLDELAQGEGDAAHRVFDRSFNLPLLNNGGRAALLALSLFVPNASRSALAEVAGLDNEKNKKKFREATKHLAALWLIRTIEDGTRLTVEGLTRDLAKARLGSDQRSSAIRERFVARFANFATNNSRETVADLNALESEKENLLAAIDVACFTKRWKPAVQIYLDMSPLLDIRGYGDDALSRGDKIRNGLIDTHNKYALGTIAEVIANTRLERGEYAEAEQLYSENLIVFKELNSHWDISNTLFNLGRLAHQKGELERAKDFYKESLEIDERLGFEKGVANIKSALGALASDEEDITEARRLYSESLEINRRLDNQRIVAISLYNLSLLDQKQGKYDQARQLCLQSLEIEKKLGHQRVIAASLNALGSLERKQGRLEAAHQLCAESYEIAKKLSNQRGEADALMELGLIALEQKKLAEARQFFKQKLEIEQRLGSQLDIADGLHELASVDLEEGALDSAEGLLNQSLSMLRALKIPSHIADCLETFGRLRAAQGFFSEAREFYREALVIAETMGLNPQIASIKYECGMLSERENNFSEAKKLLHEALEIFESLGSPKANKVKTDLQRLEIS
jgi:tetratricopeptide (TPR) repeat protein